MIQKWCAFTFIESDNVNVHRAAAKIIVSETRAARGSVCNVLLSWHTYHAFNVGTRVFELRACR